ncbi:MAG TPA: hypothetical protein VHY57_10045, partial [Rhizomicrobium sp.]|nr:hypothetical protein [Rhizomicrobium sp.]
IERFREDLYIYSPKATQYTADGLRARWGRWLANTPEGRAICRRRKEWMAAQVKEYDWDIEPDDADHPTIHGLRGTSILARAEQSHEVDQTANDNAQPPENKSTMTPYQKLFRSPSATPRASSDPITPSSLPQ